MLALVGRMDAVARLTETGQYRVNVQDTLEISHNRHTAPAAGKDRRGAPYRLQGGLQRAHFRRAAFRDNRIGRVELLHLVAHGRRRMGSQVTEKLVAHIVRVLVRHQAHRNFGLGRGRQNGLGAFAGKARQHAVDFERRPRANPFHSREISFTPQRGHAGLLAIMLIGVGQTRQLRAFFGAQRTHPVIETWQRNAAIRVVHAGNQITQHLGGVVNHAAKAARVQVARGAVDDQIIVSQAAQRVANGRNGVDQAAGIRVQREVAGEQIAVVGDEVSHTRRADLLFTLDQKLEIDRQAAGVQHRFDAVQNRRHLAFHVGRATRMDVVAHKRGGKGVACPQRQRIGGLHIVVPVDQHGGRGRPGARPCAKDDRMARRGHDLHLRHADRAQAVGNPGGRALNVGRVLRVGRDGGDAQEFLVFA